MYTTDIEISMPGYSKEVVSQKDIIFFNIELTYNSEKWTLKKRYNEFLSLDKKLKETIPSMPKLPGKTFMRRKDEQFLINRKCKLELYLIELISRQNVFGVPEFLEFLEVSLKTKIDQRARK
jgi:hypothetical protein